MKTLQILLLEDSLVDAELIQTHLDRSNLHFRLVRVETRSDFLAALETNSFDLILADYVLPDFDGISALKLVRDRDPELPFIIVSGTLGEEVAVETLKSGATDYVLKQGLQRLVSSIERAVREKKERAKRQRMEQALYRRHQEFKALVENAPDLIFRFDRSLRHVYVNPAVETAVGMPQAAFLGKTHAQMGLAADKCDRWQENLRRIFATAEEQTMECDYPAPDGTVRSYQVRMVPELTQGGSVEFVLSVARDFTEQKWLMQREQEARAQAEAANRVKDEFLAVLSHELRTPLNAIVGYAQLLRNGKLDQTMKAKALEVIERNAQLQTQLIEDLLDISRILQGKLNLNVTTVELASLVRVVIDSLQLAAQAKSIEIQAPHLGEGKILGDRNRLQQVIWNLLSNAIKFTPPKGRIECRLREVGSQAQLQIIDSGQGIPKDFLPYIFDYFRQADGSTTRAHGGLGLGLAIARYLVELHRGTIAAESAGKGQGATFTVELPLANTQAENGQQSQSGKPTSLKEIKILVVEDDRDARQLISLMLEKCGAEVVAVASAAEALQTLQQFKPDVLISDISMPQTDGYTLLRKLRALPPKQGGQIPAIALSAYVRQEDAQRALAAGFQLHKAKPISVNELVAAVLEVMDSRVPS